MASCDRNPPAGCGSALLVEGEGNVRPARTKRLHRVKALLHCCWELSAKVLGAVISAAAFTGCATAVEDITIDVVVPDSIIKKSDFIGGKIFTAVFHCSYDEESAAIANEKNNEDTATTTEDWEGELVKAHYYTTRA